MGRFYLTTAIDYSNGDPHLGHALEKIGADVIARYRRLRGDQVHFLMGMDEHSQSVVQAAEEHGVAPAQWVERMAERFARFWARLECSHDEWIRTTEPRHVHAVEELLRRIGERNPEDIYLADYEGLYCTGCEEFKQASQIVEGRCIEHPSLDLIPTRERNHFFRLSRYRDRLRELLGNGELRIEPRIRRNEIVSLLDAGLQDISISRSRFPWGIPFPGSPGHTVYVWFDALINYLSATGFPDPGYENLWPADLHVIGKGISRFHCTMWPAMLLSAGVALPRKVWVHGYVQWGGAKMSKTAGTAVTLEDAVDRYGSDALRYFLMREIGFESDGNFTWDRYDERYHADLADGLGNLVSRTLAMIAKYRGSVIPDGSGEGALDQRGRETVRRYATSLDETDLKIGLEAVWEFVAAANQHIVLTEPWALAKSGRERELDQVLHSLAACLYRLAVLTWPYMPRKAAEILLSVGSGGDPVPSDWTALDGPPVGGRQITRSAILFPKREFGSHDPVGAG